jgi:hypothetical protein
MAKKSLTSLVGPSGPRPKRTERRLATVPILHRPPLAVGTKLATAALALALLGLLSGCGSSRSSHVGQGPPGRCGKGRMQPVTITDLVTTFRANRISLHNEHQCASPPSLAQASNGNPAEGPSAEEVTAREGDVICTIEPRSIGRKVSQSHYRGDQQTYLSVLNVLCAIFPSDDTHAARQTARLSHALQELVRLQDAS